jgi:xanthine dehydrogenase molybdopterin-binding subunit B
MLGNAAFFALQDAVAAAAPGRTAILVAPATPERVLMAIG